MSGTHIFEIVPTVAAWFEGNVIPGATSMDRPPDIQLQVVDDDCDALTVKIVEGSIRHGDRVLHLAERGSYEIAAALRRASDGERSVFLRLRLARETLQA
jgi:hypothetical protein